MMTNKGDKSTLATGGIRLRKTFKNGRVKPSNKGAKGLCGLTHDKIACKTTETNTTYSDILATSTIPKSNIPGNDAPIFTPKSYPLSIKVPNKITHSNNQAKSSDDKSAPPQLGTTRRTGLTINPVTATRNCETG